MKGLGFALAIGISGLTHGQPKVLPPLLEEIETKYTNSQTLTADFTQTNFNAAFSKKKVSSGHIYFKRPSKIRWETITPDTNLMVSDGKHFWFYTPPFDPDERGQVIERPASAIQSKLANALLSGSFSVARAASIKQTSPNSFQLVPLPGTADTVQQATLEVDPAQKLITKVYLEHRGGNKSEITLSKISIGSKLDDKLFVFIPPPNTDKVTD